jgi:hypothetical protein
MDMVGSRLISQLVPSKLHLTTNLGFLVDPGATLVATSLEKPSHLSPGDQFGGVIELDLRDSSTDAQIIEFARVEAFEKNRAPRCRDRTSLE